MALDTVDLSVHIEDPPPTDDNNLLFLLRFPHNWKRLLIGVDDTQRVVSLFKSCQDFLPFIEELDIISKFPLQDFKKMKSETLDTVASSIETGRGRLKAAAFQTLLLPSLLPIGILNTVSTLTLERPLSPFSNHSNLGHIYEKEVIQSLHLLSHLPSLKHLDLRWIHWRNSFGVEPPTDGCPSLRCDSLRSLRISGCDPYCIIKYLELFADCNIESIAVPVFECSELLLKALDQDFPNLKHIEFFEAVSEVLFSLCGIFLLDRNSVIGIPSFLLRSRPIAAALD